MACLLSSVQVVAELGEVANAIVRAMRSYDVVLPHYDSVEKMDSISKLVA